MRRADHSERESDHQSLRAAALEATETGVWEWDLQTDRVEWSPTLEWLFGLEPGTFEGTAEAHARHFSPDDPSAFEAWADGVDDESGEFESRIVHADGEKRWLLIRGDIEYEDGEPARLLGVAVNITERKERERELATELDRLDQFASLVSHDMRNPLTVAKGSYDLFEESGDPADLDGLRDALDRIEEITTDMLALARHGTIDGDREPIALGDIAELAWESIDTREATLTIDSDCTIEADASQLRTLFENLFKNAVGHGGHDASVTVGCIPEGFYVEDDGPGIPEADREQVFEHGFTTGYGGTGAGLTIVRRVAEAHDWAVALREGASGGARFEFVGDAGTCAEQSSRG